MTDKCSYGAILVLTFIRDVVTETQNRQEPLKEIMLPLCFLAVLSKRIVIIILPVIEK